MTPNYDMIDSEKLESVDDNPDEQLPDYDNLTDAPQAHPSYGESETTTRLRMSRLIQSEKFDIFSIWRNYDEIFYSSNVDKSQREEEAAIIYFKAIKKGHLDCVRRLIEDNIVTVETKSWPKRTPLATACRTGSMAMVNLLLDLGANPNSNGLSKPTKPTRRIPARGCVINRRRWIDRTPLQVAAEYGHLPIVKLLMEKYHADDSIIATDGQTARRLAAANGHKEIVKYLPRRSGGGFLGWQARHRDEIHKATVIAIISLAVLPTLAVITYEIGKQFIVKPVIKLSDRCVGRIRKHNDSSREG